MKRNVTSLLVFLALVAPASAQDRRPAATSSERPEADVFSGALDAISRMHLSAMSDSALFEAAIKGMISSLNDPYADVFTPDESELWEEETTGNYSGIGLQITLLNEEVTVTGVFRGEPAEQAGIQVGDVIVGVNEHDATSWDTGMAADSIRGPVGTMVRVRIQREGIPDALPFELERAQVHVRAVHYGVLDSDIGYVVLDRVARNASRELDEALDELDDTRGLIIDLRRNPGGFLDESLMLADLFLKPGSTLASTTQRNPSGETSTESYTDRWPARVPDLPLVVLVDGYTASGAEILAGALQDYDRALVLGARSFGKGLVQNVMSLPHGRRIRFTTGEWKTPLGRSLHRARDSEMRLIEENVDTLPRVTSGQGRSLVNGGGIFPDLAIEEDSLTGPERDLLTAAAEREYPLGLRVAELAFQIARESTASGTEAVVLPARLDGFLTTLVDQGLPAEVVQAPGVRSYLDWRIRVTIAQRLDDIGGEADFRMERDPVLADAVRLLGAAGSQEDLFRAAALEVSAATGGAGAGGAPTGQGGR